MLNKYIKRLKRKLFKTYEGVLIFQLIYKPQKEGRNVFVNSIHPDLWGDGELNILLDEVGEKVREFYNEYPELLDEQWAKEKGNERI